LLGRVRKWTAIGRPLQAVSELSMMLWEKARGRAPVRLVSMAGHVRLVLCLLQALEELHALGRRLLCRLAVRIRFGLHINGPLSASLHALAPLCPRASSARAWCCGRWRGRRGVVNGLLVDTQGVARSRRSPASLQTPLAPRAHSTPTMHPTSHTFGGCTYRHFLALRRATLAVSHSSAGGFALGRTFHFGCFAVAYCIQVSTNDRWSNAGPVSLCRVL
jgi:hypothetical protein